MEMQVEDIWMAHFKAIVEREAREGGSLRAGYRSVAAKLIKSEEYIYQLYKQKPKSDGSPRTITLAFSRSLARHYAEGRPIDWINHAPITGIGASDTGSTSASAPVQINGNWPFKRVSYKRFMALPRSAQREIDEFLEGLVVTKERKIATESANRKLMA